MLEETEENIHSTSCLLTKKKKGGAGVDASDSHLDQSRDRQVYVLITSIFLLSGKFLIFVVSESTFFTVTESLLYGSRFLEFFKCQYISELNREPGSKAQCRVNWLILPSSSLDKDPFKTKLDEC